MNNNLGSQSISSTYQYVVQTRNGLYYDGLGNQLIISGGATGPAGQMGATGATGPMGATGTNYNFDSAFIITGLTVSLQNIPAQSVIANTSSSTGEPLGWIGYSTGTSSNTLVQRDINSNIFINNYAGTVNTNPSYGGTFSLTSASGRIQIFSGAIGCSVILPDATTLINGHTFLLNANQSSGFIKVYTSGNTLLFSMPVGAYVKTELITNSFPSGTWDYQFYAPQNISWGSSGLSMSGNISTGNLQITNIPQTTNNNSILVIDGGGIIYSQTASYLTQSALIGYVTASVVNGYLTQSSLYNYFINNGNSFGTAAIIGTNDNNTLSIESNNQTIATYATNSIINYQPVTINDNGIGINVLPGLWLNNTTLATGSYVNGYQNSPALYLSGYAATTSAYPTSPQVFTRIYTKATDTNSALLNFVVDYSIGGSTWSNIFTWARNNGYFSVNGGFSGTFLYSNSSLALQGSTLINFANSTVIGNAGSTGIFNFLPQINQGATQTAPISDFVLNRTQTSVGTGTQRLMTLKVNSTELYGIDNNGIGWFSSTFSGYTNPTASLVLQNLSVSSTSSTSNSSPYLQLSGYGWITATTQSYTASVRMYSVPGAGSANSLFILDGNYGSGWKNMLFYNSSANTLYVGNTGTILSPVIAGAIQAASLYNPSSYLQLSSGYSNTGFMVYVPSTITAASNTTYFNNFINCGVYTGYSQATASTASNIDLLIFRQETSVGVGKQRLISAGISATGSGNLVQTYQEKFGVDDNGKLNFITGIVSSPVGTASLVSGVTTVLNKVITANSMVQLTSQSTIVGNLYLNGITSGASFSIKSTNSSDTATVMYWIIN